MLSALAGAVLWFRFAEGDPRLRPRRRSDALLVVSAAGFVAVGLWTAWQTAAELLATLP
jgi:hypothetical protein